MSDDRELWERIRSGDARAFGAFHQDTAPRLQHFLRWLLGENGAEDVTQETFMQLWKQPNGFQPDRGALRAYVFGIGRKRAIEWLRKNRPASDQAPGESAEPGKGAEVLSAIGDAFARLAADQRSLLWLREVEGYSYAELAGILRIPVGTVRSRLFTAREALREIWRGAKVSRKDAQ